MIDPDFRHQRILLYRDAQSAIEASFHEIIHRSSPITVDNVEAVEQALMDKELEHAEKLALELHECTPFPNHDCNFAHQLGSTCMSTSTANGMLVLEEPFFQNQTLERVQAFTQHVVDNTSSFGKPFEYRSIDDMHKYLKRNDHQHFSLGSEQGFERRYRCELTNSLIDVIMAFHSGRGAVVVQQSAHAQLAFQIIVEDQQLFVCQRDPFTRHGTDYFSRIALADWRQHYLWSPLKKIPSTMGSGFESLTAEEVLDHLARYESMDNLGVECVSGILIDIGAL